MAEKDWSWNDGIPFLVDLEKDRYSRFMVFDCGRYTEEKGNAPLFDDGGRIDVVRMVMVAEYGEPYDHYVLDSDMTLGCFMGGFWDKELVTPQDVYLQFFELVGAHAYVDEESGHVRIKAEKVMNYEKKIYLNSMYERRWDMKFENGKWVSASRDEARDGNIVNSLHPYPTIRGRFDVVREETNNLFLNFSGSYVEFITDSKIVTFRVETDSVIEDTNLTARIGIYIDDAPVPVVDTVLVKEKNEFNVSMYESKGWKEFHKIRLERLSEAAFGTVKLTTFALDDGSRIYGTPDKQRKIEFIGDSITCGYGVESSCETDTFKTSEENAEKAYAIQTARALNADFHLVSWSGIGIITNWVPEDVNEPLEEILMPKLYEYTGKNCTNSWEYCRYEPDLIVINLGTNDDSYTRKIPDRVEYFGEKYYQFLKKVHSLNPDSSIMAILGTMGQNLCDEEAAQVEKIKEEYPELKIKYVVMPEQMPEEDGYGADYHPTAATQTKAARYLIEEVKDFMCW